MTSDDYLKAVGVTREELKNEVWEDIPRFEGYYQASSLGRIRSIEHKIRHYVVGFINRKGTVLCLSADRHNYLYVSLSKMGVRKNYRVSRLVLAAFFGWQDNLVTLHKDDNTINNRINNLVWGTNKENTQDALSKKRLEYGERHHAAKINYEIVDKIFELKKNTKMTNDEIGKLFGVTKSCIQSVLAGTTWTVR